MCVNDIICHAARPLFFLDYIGSGKLEKKIALDIVKGVARGCEQAGMSLVGGETAQLRGLYRPGEYDLAGFAVGIVERARDPRAVERARRRRPDRARIQRPSLQRLFAGAQGLCSARN